MTTRHGPGGRRRRADAALAEEEEEPLGTAAIATGARSSLSSRVRCKAPPWRRIPRPPSLRQRAGLVPSSLAVRDQRRLASVVANAVAVSPSTFHRLVPPPTTSVETSGATAGRRGRQLHRPRGDKGGEVYADQGVGILSGHQDAAAISVDGKGHNSSIDGRLLERRRRRVDDVQPALAGLGDGDSGIAAIARQQIARAGELGALGHRFRCGPRRTPGSVGWASRPRESRPPGRPARRPGPAS